MAVKYKCEELEKEKNGQMSHQPKCISHQLAHGLPPKLMLNGAIFRCDILSFFSFSMQFPKSGVSQWALTST